MLIACWSVKGGAGVSVVAASLAYRLAFEHRRSLLVDLGGDQPDITGIPTHCGAGVANWLGGGHSLAELEVPLPGGVRLLPRGRGVLTPGQRGAELLAELGRRAHPVVIDCGTPIPAVVSHDAELAWQAAGAAARSLLVIRPCLPSLRRALAAPLRPSAAIVLEEPGRALHAGDVEQVLGVPIAARVAVDPTIARAVDAGLLFARPPRPLQHGLRHAA